MGRTASSGMIPRRDQAAIPAITGRGNQVRVFANGLGTDGQIHGITQHHGHQLARRTLVKLDFHLGEGLAKAADQRGEHITRLGMGGANAQDTPAFLHSDPG
jgi:hypothetical protein